MTPKLIARLSRGAAAAALAMAVAACGGAGGSAPRQDLRAAEPGKAGDDAGAQSAHIAQADLPADAPLMVVYKSPTCGCCAKWIDHVKANGFRVEVHDVTDNVAAKKAEWRVPGALHSCHTAKVGDYVLEGHVPAEEIKRLLAEKPAVAGLAVPGMPMGSPGMEGPYPADKYDVVAFTHDGQTSVFASK
jgi:hypothetical protein